MPDIVTTAAVSPVATGAEEKFTGLKLERTLMVKPVFGDYGGLTTYVGGGVSKEIEAWTTYQLRTRRIEGTHISL